MSNNSCIKDSSKALNVTLVNLISPRFIVRHQSPFAIHILAGYLKKKVKNINLKLIDMQEIFDNINNQIDKSIEKKFDKTIDSTIEEICKLSGNEPQIIGLSLKWDTQNVAQKIIEKTRKILKKENILFVFGNIGSTYGYKKLLMHPSFNDTLAVISEGEDALAQIVSIVIKNSDNIIDTKKYNKIENVARRIGDKIVLGGLKRVELDNYPEGTITDPKGIYDNEFKSYAMESSRGCPWGNCTFCSVGSQFGGLDSHFIGDSQWKAFPLELIIANIKQLIRKGILTFDFKDSEFFGSVKKCGEDDPFFVTMERVQKFANSIIEINKSLGDKKIIINHISARVDTVYRENQPKKNIIRRETYCLLKKAGLRGIFLGVESGSVSQIKRYAKGVTIKENREAIKILRDIGIKLEVGFILFDPFVTIGELAENMQFIESTNLFKTDSRILGSLRIQEGSSYVNMVKKAGLIGKKDDNLLCYSSNFKNNNVAEIENIFKLWEKSTQKLIKLLPENLRLENYKLNFFFLKEIINCYLNKNIDKIYSIVEKFSKKRKIYLVKIRKFLLSPECKDGNKKLVEEYLVYAFENNFQPPPLDKKNFLLNLEASHE